MALIELRHPLAPLDEAGQRLLGRVHELVRDEIGPNAARVNAQDTFAWDTFRLLAREGVIATAFPRAYGGSEATMLLRVRLIEALASACSVAASIVTGTDLSSRPIVAGGSEALKREWLPALADGSRQSAFALTERDAGSDVANLQTRARVCEGGWRLSGVKKFITRADTADTFVVAARTGEGRSGARGLSAFLVDRGTPGLSVSPTIPKMGWHGVPIAEVRLDEVPVDPSRLLGEEGAGFRLAQDTLLRARIGHAAIALGRMSGALEMASQYALHRRAFGAPIGDHQGLRWMLADAAARIEAARCLVYASAQRYDAGDADAAVHASIAKMHVTDLGMRIVVDCLQVFGGNGYLKAYPLERFVRDAKLNQIGEGTSEIHKNVIGRWLLEQAGTRATHPCLDLDPDLYAGDVS